MVRLPPKISSPVLLQLLPLQQQLPLHLPLPLLPPPRMARARIGRERRRERRGGIGGSEGIVFPARTIRATAYMRRS